MSDVTDEMVQAFRSISDGHWMGASSWDEVTRRGLQATLAHYQDPRIAELEGQVANLLHQLENSQDELECEAVDHQMTKIIGESQEAQIATLREALNAFVDEICDYATINKLGDPEKQHNIKRARKALAGTAETLLAHDQRIWNEAVEACAKVADQTKWENMGDTHVGRVAEQTAKHQSWVAAEAIRALKKGDSDG